MKYFDFILNLNDDVNESQRHHPRSATDSTLIMCYSLLSMKIKKRIIYFKAN